MRAQAKLALKKKQLEQPDSQLTRLDWSPLPKQKLALETPAFETLYGGAAGGGKALELHTPIATPRGWREMGDLRVGDQVFGSDGMPVRVLAVSDEMLHLCYRLTFDDGAEVVADTEHSWLTYDATELSALTRRTDVFRERRRSQRPTRSTGKRPDVVERNHQREIVVTDMPTGKLRITAEIAATLHTKTGRTNHAIPVAPALWLERADLPLDPYLLGLWLGDGASQGARFTTQDAELLQAFINGGFVVTRNSGSYAYGITDGFKTALRNLNLLNNKHIPDAYLWASAAQRLALLQGLLDTDGTCTKSGSAEFTNTNHLLAEGVAHLVRSLGMKATVRAGRAKLRGKDCGPKWTIKFKANQPVFRLARKLARLQLATRRTTRLRYIVACESVGVQRVKCIQVAAVDGIFLAGRDLVPTHNSDLLVAVARLYHRKVVLLRRSFPDLERSLILRSTELYGDRHYYNAGKHVWNFEDGQRIEFGHLKDDNSVHDYQSAQYDLIGFDELTQFTRHQYEYMLSRARSTVPGQRVRIIACSNPGNEGNDWVMERWAAWLDEGYPDPAQPGEVRWFKHDAEGHEHPTTEDDPEGLSRTFVPALLQDNPYLPDEYRKQLNALPEPWRSQLKDGKWSAGLYDDPYQLVPTSWLKQAQARWIPEGRQGFLTCLGVDPARGGQDKTVLCPRYGVWVGPLTKVDGKLTPTGFAVVQLMLPILAKGGRAAIDIIGIGSAVIDNANELRLDTQGVNVSSPSDKTDKSGKIRMVNLRAYLYWKLREALDPEGDIKLQLPPDPELFGELRATKWVATTRGIKIIDKDEIKDRLGRSPNCADALMLSMQEPEVLRGGVGRVF